MGSTAVISATATKSSNQINLHLGLLSFSFSFTPPARHQRQSFFSFFLPDSNLPRLYPNDRFSPRSGSFLFALSAPILPPPPNTLRPRIASIREGQPLSLSPEALVTTPALLYLKHRVAFGLAVLSLVCAFISTHPLDYLEFLRDGRGTGPGPF